MINPDARSLYVLLADLVATPLSVPEIWFLAIAVLGMVAETASRLRTDCVCRVRLALSRAQEAERL